MEANLRPDCPPPPAVFGGADELNQTNSDASFLTAQNCEDNETMDECTTWTDEKHSSYLNNLEVSFVKQLHQSMGLLAPCSQLKPEDRNISLIRPINVQNASGQITVLRYGCWQKHNYERSKPLSRTRADSHNPRKSPWMYGAKRMRKLCPPPSSDMPEFPSLCNTENHGKGIETRRHKYFASEACNGDLYDLTKEGTGQNFVDEDNHNKSNTKPRLKKSKTALADTSHHDQIVPSTRCLTTDIRKLLAG
ncbi:hypothetical protein BUALT_Bualt19G0109400 [Buddleja alternifolia]|uniref:Uncharacterized protein n=1 Tax=Buddleja alternifolia TaxID=168488 RepID=A0AAV6W6U5_9LAMI|nr:hypothetical protein BUALT_Bualt19G0109400 [Buddleja alternifolia]